MESKGVRDAGTVSGSRENTQSFKNNPEKAQTYVQELLARTAALDTESFIDAILDEFGDGLAFATSLGAEDQVLVHLLQNRLKTRAGDLSSLHVFTLDTGRLPEETYNLLTENRYSFEMPIHSYFPDAAEVEALIAKQGANGFYDSVEARKACCAVRKVHVLKRALAGKDGWFVGLRKDQSPTRTDLHRIEWDAANGLLKFSPLLDWTSERVWAYIKEYKIPYNSLHDRGYPSIGCAPCTRAVRPGEDERAGRWWWENPENKECGLHAHGAPEAKPARFSFGSVQAGH